MAKIEQTDGGYLKTCFETASCEVTKIDRNFFNLTGYSEDEIIGKKTFEVFQKLFGMDLSNHSFNDGSGCFLFTRHGKAIEVAITRRPTDNGSIYIFESGTEGLVADRHAIIRQQAEIMYEKNKQYEIIFDNIDNTQELFANQYEHLCKIIDVMDLPFICLSYPDLRIIKFNKKAVKDMGELFCYDLPDSDATGMDLLRFIPCNNEITEKFGKMESEKSTEHVFKLELDRNDGKTYYNLVFQPVLDYRKEITEVLIIGIDITNEVHKMEYIENILKMKDEFLSMISHEFKTPLCVINAAIQAMEVICRDELTDKIRDYIDKIRHNSFRQLRLVNNLLDVTRANSGNIRINRNNTDIVMLTKAIVESVKLYARQKGLTIAFDSNVTSRIISMDEEKYERILLNLLSNSIKFTQPGKTIRIGLDVGKDSLLLSVRDEGIGIPKDKQVLIFERFGQVDSTLSRQAEGTGIGLSLVKSMVNALGGEISVESEIGKGSVFSVKLPCKKCLELKDSDLLPVQIDKRLIQATAIEFSDIYLYNV